MSLRLRKFAPTLRKLNRLKPDQKKVWLKKHLDNELICCLCEYAKHLLNGNVPITAAQRKKLVVRKESLRKLVRRKVSLRNKKRILQRGGFLAALLGPIVSVLGSLLGNNQ